MGVHDLTGALLVLATWAGCSIGGGVLGAFIDGERRPARNTLALLSVGLPVAAGQLVQGWALVAVLILGVTTTVAGWWWFQSWSRPGLLRASLRRLGDPSV